MVQQFTAVALPIIIALAGAAWMQNKRLDDIIGRLNKIDNRLDSIETKLEHYGNRIVVLEERTSPLRGR
jgi:archaellum component FlaC